MMPIIRCIKNYKIRQYLVPDISSGVTVAIMPIPQGIAYGVLAGLSPTYGAFAIISLMIAKALDGIPLDWVIANSNYNASDSNFSNMSSSVNATADEILAQKTDLATTLAFFVELIQANYEKFHLWVIRVGFITSYMSEPFISGFNTGAAIQVFSNQVPPFFGVDSARDIQGAFKLPRFYVRVIGSIFREINWVTTAVGAASMVFMYVVKRLNERCKAKVRILIPTELIVVIIGALVSYHLKLNEKDNVAILGTMECGLPKPKFPGFNQSSSLFRSSILIDIVSLSLSITVAKMFGQKHGYRELFAYGISNMIASCFHCFPNATSLSRSTVQDSSGGKTILVGGFTSIIVLIVILALEPLFKPLPNTVLAAIIILNLKGLLFQVKDFKYYYRIDRLEAAVWIITCGTIVLFDVDIGLYVGIGISFLINTIRTQNPSFAILGRVGDTEFYKNIKRFPTVKG
ncbi:unnamed protein product [Rotaria magnacalcarata]|uniref:SLC26A/SulP transporter domain-containing protein n=1 Tax=Rotaria magnacalcarata TaxID=392030 RepID=A0A820PEL9_9BILA|nr:unnamed protein product [Rotaria magnacalcarata]